MCLAIPGKIIEVLGDDVLFRTAKVSFGGIIKHVNLVMLPEAKLDDYVLVHVGVAISIVNEDEAQKTFNYLKQMGEVEELGE
jgi:hydrogenase expression/formation protein HypC